MSCVVTKICNEKGISSKVCENTTVHAIVHQFHYKYKQWQFSSFQEDSFSSHLLFLQSFQQPPSLFLLLLQQVLEELLGLQTHHLSLHLSRSLFIIQFHVLLIIDRFIDTKSLFLVLLDILSNASKVLLLLQESLWIIQDYTQGCIYF